MYASIRLGLTLVLAGLLAGCGASSQATPSDSAVGTSGSGIAVEQAWVRPVSAMEGMTHDGNSMAMGATSAAYMLLRNNGSSADAVVKASTDIAEAVEFHTSVTENNVASMRPLAQIEVPVGGQAELKPGGLHMMLVGVKHDLKAGDTVALVLTMQSGAEVKVSAPVQQQAP